VSTFKGQHELFWILATISAGGGGERPDEEQAVPCSLLLFARYNNQQVLTTPTRALGRRLPMLAGSVFISYILHWIRAKNGTHTHTYLHRRRKKNNEPSHRHHKLCSARDRSGGDTPSRTTTTGLRRRPTHDGPTTDGQVLAAANSGHDDSRHSDLLEGQFP
jgi:hypothetical protein